MSSETQTNTDVTTRESCTACNGTLREKRLALQTYAESEKQAIAGLSAGGLLYCPDCAAEPVTLLDNWASHDQPPIDSDRAIGAGYRAASDCCSFCADSLGTDSVVGVELYRRPGETLPAYANYTLCPDCTDVFEEFLANVQS